MLAECTHTYKHNPFIRLTVYLKHKNYFKQYMHGHSMNNVSILRLKSSMYLGDHCYVSLLIRKSVINVYKLI